MSNVHIYDERVTRHDRDMKVLLENVGELKNLIENNNVKLMATAENPEVSNTQKVDICEDESSVKKLKQTKSDAVILIKPKNNQN